MLDPDVLSHVGLQLLNDLFVNWRACLSDRAAGEAVATLTDDLSLRFDSYRILDQIVLLVFDSLWCVLDDEILQFSADAL